MLEAEDYLESIVMSAGQTVPIENHYLDITGEKEMCNIRREMIILSECHHDHCIGSDELGSCSCKCHLEGFEE